MTGSAVIRRRDFQRNWTVTMYVLHYLKIRTATANPATNSTDNAMMSRQAKTAITPAAN
jgi:hypothetical protein